MSAKLTLTTEQGSAVELYQAEQSVLLVGGRACGKTTTLQTMAASTDRHGILLTFKASETARAHSGFPISLAIKTAFSLAEKSVAALGYSQAKLRDELEAVSVVQLLHLADVRQGSVRLNALSLGALVRSTIDCFLYSADEQVDVHHVKRSGKLHLLSDAEFQMLARYVARVGRALWNRMADKNDSAAPLGKYGCLKLWSLAAEPMQTEYILLDDAHECPQVVSHVLSKQVCQCVYAIDSLLHKCNYSSQLADSARAYDLTDVPHKVELNKVFDSGSEFTAIANAVSVSLASDQNSVGNSAISSRVGRTDPEAIICRNHYSVMLHAVDAMSAGKSVHVVDCMKDILWLLTDLQSMRRGHATTYRDFHGFDSWEDLLSYCDAQHPGSRELSTLVALLDSYGDRHLLQLFRQIDVTDKLAELTLLPFDRVGNLAFNRVALEDSRELPTLKSGRNLARANSDSAGEPAVLESSPSSLPADELLQLYVACSCARLELQLPDWCKQWLGTLGKVSADSATAPVNSKLKGAGQQFAIVEFQTIGMHPQQGDRAIEIALVLVENGKVSDRFHSLMRSSQRVGPEITALTGINNDVLQRAPDAEVVMRQALAFIGNATLVTHHTSVNKRFWIKEVFLATGRSIQPDFVSTSMLSQRLYPDVMDYQLPTLGIAHDLQIPESGRTLADANMTAELLCVIIADLSRTHRVNKVDAEFLTHYQSLSKQRLVELMQGDPDIALDSHGLASSDELDGALIVQGNYETRYSTTGEIVGYQVYLRHKELGDSRTISARNSVLLEGKLLAQSKRWKLQWRLHLERQQQQDDHALQLGGKELARRLTKEAAAAIAEIENIFNCSVDPDVSVSWNVLKDSDPFHRHRGRFAFMRYAYDGKPEHLILEHTSDLEPQRPSIEEPPEPDTYLVKIGVWKEFTGSARQVKQAQNRKFEEDLKQWNSEKSVKVAAYREAMAIFEERVRAIEIENARRRHIFEQELSRWQQLQTLCIEKQVRLNTHIDQLQQLYRVRDSEAVEEYCSLVLDQSEYPGCIPRNFNLSYDSSAMLLLVNLQLPCIDDLPNLQRVRYFDERAVFDEKFLTKAATFKLLESAVFQMIWRTVRELFQADQVDALDAICVNGVLVDVNPATGRRESACVASMHLSRAEFSELELSDLKPREAFKAQKGRASARLNIASPVMPLVASQALDTFREAVTSASQSTEIAVPV